MARPAIATATAGGRRWRSTRSARATWHRVRPARGSCRPVRGPEVGHTRLDERPGRTEVILPVYRTNQMGVMRLRSEADLAALKAPPDDARTIAGGVTQ